MRYRLSWLLSLPILLAFAIWWLKPPRHASYTYLAEQHPDSTTNSSIYHVKQLYLDQQLLLFELKDCDYAVIFVGADWSPNAKVNCQNLRQASEHYRGRVPIFICGFVADEVFNWFPGKINSKYFDSILCIVQRGVITHQFHDYLGTPKEIHALLKRSLPWNYSL